MTPNNKQVKVYYDPKAKKLTVWFGGEQDDYIAEPTGKDFLLLKDKSGEIIGINKLNYVVPEKERLLFAFEIVSV